MILHVLRTPMKVTHTAQDCREARWCFKCRKRLPHSWEMHATVEPGWYDPHPELCCSGCDGDYTLGFGQAWDGPHYPEERLVWVEAS